MTGTVAGTIWLVILVVLAIIALALIVWSVKRRRSPKLTETSGAGVSPKETVAGLGHTTVVGGNRIELLQNGTFFDSLFADIEKAAATINIETFLCKEGEVTRRLTEALLRKRKSGVEVRVLLDGSGSKNYGDDDLERLRNAGCAVRMFHPFVISNLGRFNQRTHRKIVIIDGRIGYVGGHCLVDSWLGDAEDRKHFRDITARVEGAVVNQLQSAFSENWVEETGEVFAGEQFFPKAVDAGSSEALVVFGSPSGGPSLLKVLHYVAINEAKRSITIQNPYFLPDPDARDALVAAVKRGVEVRVMIPSTEATDAKLVSHASHHHYGTLLKGGVRIFDYEQTLLHQKVFVIDGAWASIGSTNFDDRSFEINEEVSLVVWDEQIAQQLEATFAEDVVNARERQFDEWSGRPILHKLKDFSAFLVNEQL
ncbi:MAG TPA: phospholipase D-like domain-containing protein [Thermoanaerobaculia bacterium]